MQHIPAGSWSTKITASWGSMDSNGHLANSAYLSMAADVRLAFFAEHGFPPRHLHRLGIGPVIRKDDLEYFREIHLHEAVKVTCALDAMSPDGARYIAVNEFWSASNRLAARVRSRGGWFSLATRQLVAPPAELLSALLQVPRTGDFRELPTAVRPSALAAV